MNFFSKNLFCRCLIGFWICLQSRGPMLEKTSNQNWFLTSWYFYFFEKSILVLVLDLFLLPYQVSSIDVAEKCELLVSAQTGENSVIRLWQYVSSKCITIVHSEINNIKCIRYWNKVIFLCQKVWPRVVDVLQP